MTGTPVPSSAFATRAIALICGTPTPAMTRVVQIEPGPMPTLTPSAPCLTRSSAASAVTMLPPITCMSGYFALILRDHFQHAARMAVRGVHDDHIDSGFAQCRDPVQRIRRGADRGADAQAPDTVLAGIRELGGLLKILHRDHALEFMIAGHHQHLLDAMLVQQREHLFLRRVLAHRDQTLLRRHDGGNRCIQLGLEPQVAMGDDADHLGAEHHRYAGDVLRRG